MSVKPRDLLLCAAVIGLSAMLNPASAEDREVVRERTAANSGSVSMRKISTLMKTKVIIQDDEPAGQIVDFVISDGGCIEYVVASYEDEYYVIPYSAAVVRYDQDVVFVDISPTQFREVQFFAANNWPDFYAANYRQQVFTTFGVTAIRNDVDVDVDRRGRGNRGRDRDDDSREGARDREDDARDQDRDGDARDRGRNRQNEGADTAEEARERAEQDRDRARDHSKDRDRSKTEGRDNKPSSSKREAPKAPAPKADPPKASESKPTPLPKNALPQPPAPKKPAPKAPQSN